MVLKERRPSADVGWPSCQRTGWVVFTPHSLASRLVHGPWQLLIFAVATSSISEANPPCHVAVFWQLSAGLSISCARGIQPHITTCGSRDRDAAWSGQCPGQGCAGASPGLVQTEEHHQGSRSMALGRKLGNEESRFGGRARLASGTGVPGQSLWAGCCHESACFNNSIVFPF